ncbi:hypothetical protein [Sinorhizobium fredii]|uniref:hypothetical protein n=1 Tax=Rhizobium fredii TaxID=380 RepID=UPI0004B435FC|nr:hypothetical protein [Sinorhizobium fredii]
MAKIFRTEKRKRGIFGTLVWWVFLAFNGFMGLFFGLFVYHSTGASAPGSVDPAVAVVATGIGASFLSLWLTGTLILGLVVALTRGKTVMIERVVVD